MQIPIHKTKHFIALLLVAVVSSRFSANAFDVVFPNSQAGSYVVTSAIWELPNSIPGLTLEFDFPEPTPPFSLDQGSLSGVIAPGAASHAVFGFLTPDRTDSVTNEISQALNGTITYHTSSQSFTVPGIIRLSAKIWCAQPVDVRKEVGLADESVNAFDKTQLRTTVSWGSSSGKLEDLNGIQIRELLILGPEATPIGPTGETFPDFPKCGDVIGVGGYSMPRPYRQLKFPLQSPGWRSPVVQNLVGIGGKPPPGVSIFGRQNFQDGHLVLSPPLDGLPPVQGSYTLNQIYFWTIPVLKDAGGCSIWKPFDKFFAPGGGSSDVISRGVLVLNGRWTAVVYSAQADKAQYMDLGQVSAQATTLQAAKHLELDWPLVGSTLQSAFNTSGPWTDVPGSQATNKMVVSVEASNRFFRVLTPQP